MTREATVNIFAYGSNMHPTRMRRRVPSARSIGIGFVTGRTVRYQKRSMDGSAKADAPRTKDQSDVVWGVVYEIRLDQKPELDRHEYLGVGYDEELVTLNLSDGRSIDAWIYVARPAAIDDSLRPWTWYTAFIVRGALHHRLPFCYIQSSLKVAGWVDQDGERREANRRILQDKITGGP